MIRKPTPHAKTTVYLCAQSPGAGRVEGLEWVRKLQNITIAPFGHGTGFTNITAEATQNPICFMNM